MSPGWISVSSTVLVFAIAAAAAIVDLLPERRLNVIVLTVESTREDALSAHTTPQLLAIATDGTRFTRHRGSSAWTAAGIVSLLTGLAPHEHRVHSRGMSLAEGWRTPLEDIAAAGWRIGGLQSFMQVDVFDNLGLAVEPGADLRLWLAERAAASEPFVLWYHYLDTHLPYAPLPPFLPDWQALLAPGDDEAVARIRAVMKEPAIPAGSVAFEPSDRTAIEALYAGGLREFDAWFASFWQFLERSGLRRNTILVLTSDHGEELLDRGLVGHASTTHAAQLHEEIARIPLMIWLPPGDRRLPKGAVIDRNTDHLDVMPTVMALLDRTPTTRLPGGVLPDAAGRGPWIGISSLAGYSEADPAAPAGFVYAVVEDDWKLIKRADRDGAAELALYHLATDPGERHDLAGAEPERTRHLHGLLMADLAAAREPDAARHTVVRHIAGPPPEWRSPASSGAYSYDDLDGKFRLQWTGPDDADYVLQYEVGRGLLSFAGDMKVAGTEKDFGRLDRRYWDSWVVPYSPYRVRVGYAGDEPNWSPWLELEAR